MARSRPSRRSALRAGPCKVVILAGGFGTRLAERTDELPKPMVQIGGRPILWHILKIYSHFGFNEFVIACGYRADVIKRFFLEYRYQMSDLMFDFATDRVSQIDGRIEPWRAALIDTGPETHTGGRIKRLAPHLGRRRFMLTYGDGVADIDLAALLAFHRRHKRLVTVTTVRRPAQFGVARLKGERVVSFAEKPAGNGDWINGGFFVLEPQTIDAIEGDHTSFEFDTLPALARQGEVMAFRHERFWQPMDTLRDVRKLNSMWANADAPWKVWS